MISRLIYCKICFVIFNLCLATDVLSWNDEVTHRDLALLAAEKSVLGNSINLLRIGLPSGLDEFLQSGTSRKKVKYWMMDGSELEDEGSFFAMLTNNARFNNHFHNPLKQWDSAGLNDYVIMPDPGNPSLPPLPRLVFGESSALWAQDGPRQETFPGGNWSWQKIRLDYLNALIAQTTERRQEFLVDTFKGLGYQMHLVQDAAVPTHVRNDAHPLDNLLGAFETWAKANYSDIRNLASSSVPPQVDLKASSGGLVPVSQLIDTNQYSAGIQPSASYTWGLAEYTNANFVSDDTIFTDRFDPSHRHYFPYPRYNSECYKFVDVIEPSAVIPTTYLSKTCEGEPVYYFAVAGLGFKYAGFLGWEIQRSLLKLDERTYYDYAKKLVPRAVGYSAALLNYFFRGDIDMVSSGAGSSGYVIVNNSEEEMLGTFALYQDDANGNRVQIWNGYLSLGTKSSGRNRSATITLSLPCDANQPAAYMLVFSGRMGQEQGAVAGKILNPALTQQGCADLKCQEAIDKWMAVNLFDRVLSENCGQFQIQEPAPVPIWTNQWHCSEQERDDGIYCRFAYNRYIPTPFFCSGGTIRPEGDLPITEMWYGGEMRKGELLPDGSILTGCDQLKASYYEYFTASQEWVIEDIPRDGCETVREKYYVVSAEPVESGYQFTMRYYKVRSTVLYAGLYTPPDVRWSWTISGDVGYAGSGQGFCDNSGGWPQFQYEERYAETLAESVEKYLCENGIITRID